MITPAAPVACRNARAVWIQWKATLVSPRPQCSCSFILFSTSQRIASVIHQVPNKCLLVRHWPTEWPLSKGGRKPDPSLECLLQPSVLGFQDPRFKQGKSSSLPIVSTRPATSWLMGLKRRVEHMGSVLKLDSVPYLDMQTDTYQSITSVARIWLSELKMRKGKQTKQPEMIRSGELQSEGSWSQCQRPSTGWELPLSRVSTSGSGCSSGREESTYQTSNNLVDQEAEPSAAAVCRFSYATFSCLGVGSLSKFICYTVKRLSSSPLLSDRGCWKDSTVSLPWAPMHWIEGSERRRTWSWTTTETVYGILDGFLNAFYITSIFKAITLKIF